MADVGRVQGPSGPPENVGKKSEANADKFKQAMRRRVTEVSKIDPDEQKKRKRREEAEEEDDLEAPQQGPTTPASQVTPFSLEQEKKKTSPLEMQKGGPGISPTESAQPTQPPPKTAFFQAPSPSEMADDSGVLEEEAFIENIPSETGGTETPKFGAQAPSSSQPSPPPSSTEQTPAFQPSQEEGASPMPPQGQQPIAAGSAESAAGQQQQGEQQKAKVGPPETGKKQPIPGMAPTTPETLKQEQQRKAAATQASISEKEKAGSAAALEGASSSKVQDTSGFFEQMGKEGGREGRKEKKAPTPEELEKEAELQGAGAAPTAPIPFASTAAPEEKKVEEKEEAGAAMMGGPAAGTPEMLGGPAAPLPAPEALPAYANLHPQVMELFDRMVGVMTVMNMSGMTETTITLNAPQFASSVFFGSQIIIQEFSTAPKAFNIQLNGNPQAVALFQGNADDLMAAFQAGNYNFRVNRLETGYLSERPLFKRKEKAEGKDKDQTGENPR